MESARGRILVVDDDPPLLRLMTIYLSRLGYQVDSCTTTEAAKSLFDSHPGVYSLALLDSTMPGMGGDGLARRILQTSPSMRLIVASGYPSELAAIGKLPGDRVRYLQKPFTPTQLLKLVEEYLQPGLSLPRS